MARVNLGKVVPERGVDYLTPAEQAQFENDITANVENNLTSFVNTQKQDIEDTKDTAISDFNSNASTKTTTFNDNATSKTSTFNQNATDKTTAFNTNATNKTDNFNDYVEAKKAEFDLTYEPIIDNNNKLSSDLVDDTNNTNKFVTIVDKTNWNSKVDKDVNNLTNYELKTNTGSTIELSINSSTYVVTLNLKNSAGTVLSTGTIDLPLESVVVGGSYDSQTKKVVLTLQSGSTIEFSVADLVAGLQTEITSQNKLASDLIDDSNSANKFVTASDKTNWNGKEDITNKVTSISSSSTNTQYPSALAVYNYVYGIVGDIESLLSEV